MVSKYEHHTCRNTRTDRVHTPYIPSITTNTMCGMDIQVEGLGPTVLDPPGNQKQCKMLIIVASNRSHLEMRKDIPTDENRMAC